MTYWLTADTHFEHQLMADIRGFDNADEMNDCIITAWNANVKPGDVVYVLGDFALPQNTERIEGYLRQLHGTKQLILGNHDNKATTRAKGWAWTGWMKHTRLGKQLYVMSHYALRTWPGAPNDHANRVNENPRINAHGHSHAQLPPWQGQFDVGVDTRMDWSPWPAEAVTLLASQPLDREDTDVG